MNQLRLPAAGTSAAAGTGAVTPRMGRGPLARRGRRWAAALAVVVVLPAAVAAGNTTAHAAVVRPRPAASPSYGVGGVPPVPVGYTAQDPQAVAVDPVTGTVFTADAASGTVQVISESSESVVASISVASTPRALAVDPVSGTVYVGESPAGVQAITENASNPSQDAVTATVSIPQNQEGFCGPEGIGVLPGATADTGTVYVANECGNTVSVISEASNSISDTIQIPGLPSGSGASSQPVGVAVDPGTGNVFVTDSGDGYVSAISGASYLGSFPLPNPNGNIQPTGIAADPGTGTVYVITPAGAASAGLAGEVFVVQENTASPASSTVSATIPVPPYGTSGATAGVPESVAVNPNTATVYVTNEEGAVHVINENTANPAADTIGYTVGVGGGSVPSVFGEAVDTSTGNAYSGDVYADSNQTDDLYPILPQAVSFTAPSCPAPGCEVGHASTLAATGGMSGNPVIFSVDPTSGAGVCSVSGTNGTTVSYLAVGTCVIDANQAFSDYYLAAPQASASITVIPSKPQAIRWTPPGTTYYGPGTGMYGATVTLKATATSGGPVTFTVDPASSAGACTVSGTNGTTLSYTALGSCVIDANQAGNATYLPAPQVQAAIQVDPATQTITFKPPPTGLAGKSAALTATGGASGNPVILSVDPATQQGVCSLSPPNGTNSYTVTYTAVGTCVIDATQPGSAPDYLAAPPVTAVITVGVAPTFVQASPPLSAPPGSAYSYTFVASGIGAPTYALSAGAPSWLSINPGTGQVSGTVPGAGSAPPPAYTYAVTAANKYGTVTTSRFVVLPAPPGPPATAQVSSSISCSPSLGCTLTVTNNGPATQVVTSVLLPAQLYLAGQQCPDNWGCFVEANTLTWSLGTMAAGTSSSFPLNLAIAGTCPSSGCPPLVGVADTPSLDNLASGYSSSSGAASQAIPAGLRGLPYQLRRAS